MSREEIGGQKQVAPESLFKRYENLTVLSIFVGFVIIIVLWQLIMTGGHRFPTFISPVNILNILQQVGVPGIVAVGMTIVMISGGIDLSVGMLASLVSIVTALGISKWHFGVAPSILIGIMSAVVLESLMGYIISRTKVEPFIITLGGMISFQGIALLLCNSREVIMKGELDFFKFNLIQGAKDPISGLNLIIPPYVLIFFLIALLAGLLLNYTKYGRRIYAVGTNPNAAYLAGINVKEHETLGVHDHGPAGRNRCGHAALACQHRDYHPGTGPGDRQHRDGGHRWYGVEGW